MPFAELSVTSNFTFLTGASHPEEMMRRAAELGLPALAIADDNSVAGIVRAYISRTSDFLAVAALVFAATARHRETGLSE
jgi:DNA polymerase III alpha subunit